MSNIKNKISKLVKLRDGSKSSLYNIYKPSKFWKKEIDWLSYIYDLSEKSLKKIRLHVGFGFFFSWKLVNSILEISWNKEKNYKT